MLTGKSISDQTDKREEPVFALDQPRTKHKAQSTKHEAQSIKYKVRPPLPATTRHSFSSRRVRLSLSLIEGSQEQSSPNQSGCERAIPEWRGA